MSKYDYKFLRSSIAYLIISVINSNRIAEDLKSIRFPIPPPRLHSKKLVDTDSHISFWEQHFLVQVVIIYSLGNDRQAVK